MIDAKGDGAELRFYDLEGNVWEWNKDFWDGRSRIPGGKDPLGTSGSNRIARGGNWANGEAAMWTSYRYSWKPEEFRYEVGFRLVRTRP